MSVNTDHNDSNFILYFDLDSNDLLCIGQFKVIFTFLFNPTETDLKLTGIEDSMSLNTVTAMTAILSCTLTLTATIYYTYRSSPGSYSNNEPGRDRLDTYRN